MADQFDAFPGETPSGSPPPEETASGDAAPRNATPSVLAVVVAHEPGPWFEETLDSLATQDYSRLSVVVIDGAGDPALGARVREALPSASLLDAGDTEGFSAAANAILDTEVDPAFLLLCHDDVALASDAVRMLVTEALRSNAGVAGGKLVDWDRPDRLQHVALEVDRFAVATDVVDPGELDQEQFDAVTDVFAVPTACLLINTALFRTLGGFDPEIAHRGEEVDFCWRAQLVGARVMVVPDAIVRHRDRLFERTGIDDIRRTKARHQLRTVMVTSSRPGLFVTLPLMVLLTLGEALIALVTGRFSQVRDVFGAWSWNFRRLGQIRRRRKELRALTRVRHSDVRSLQEGGSVRINAFVRGQIGRRNVDQELRSLIRTGTARIAAVVGALLLGFVLFGSRSLLSDGVPAVGDFLSFGDSSGALVDEWWSGWRHRDLGSAGTAQSGLGVIGGVAWLLGGSLGLVRLLWVLGPILVGLAGAWRMLSPTGSRRAQIGSLLAYAIVPLPWASVASASISGLYGYAVAPWVLAALLHGEAASPYRSNRGPWRSRSSVAAGLGTALGVGALFEPAVVLIVVPMLVGIAIAGLLTGRLGGWPRLSVVLFGGAAVAAVLSLPQLLDQLDAGFSWAPFADGRSGAADDRSLLDIVGFAVGPDSVSPFTLLLAAPMALPLLAGRSWRFAVAARGWMIALASWGIAWAAAWGALPFGLPDPALLLAPAAAGVSVVIGAAVTAGEYDMRRAGFGWRQALVPIAVATGLLSMFPVLAAAETGRWDMPRADFTDALPLADPSADGSYRILWLAHPDHLPGGGSMLDEELVDGSIAWALSFDGLPSIGDRGVAADPGSASEVEDALALALDGDTVRLGRVLGGLGVRYVVVLDRLAPSPFSPVGVEPPQRVLDAFARQLDLRRLQGINTAMDLYVNTEWTSVRAAASTGFDTDRDGLADLAAAPLAGTAGVLGGRETSIEGPVPADTEIYVAQTPDTGWRLTVDGDRTGRRRSVGWATAFLPDAGGSAVLSYDAPFWRQGAILIQALGLLVAAGALLRRRVGTR